MRTLSTGPFVLFSALALAFLQPQPLLGEDPAPSSFAPAGDLLQQVDFFIDRAEDALSNPAAFDLAKQSRMVKDANTLVALSLVLQSHDEAFPEKSCMPALMSAAAELAEIEADALRGQQLLAQIKQARAGEASDAKKAAGTETTKASVAALMKQVPLVHTRLQRGTRPGRLSRRPEESAGQAATLAAMAQAALLDDEYAATPEEAAAWAEFCVQMRDAAGEVNSAIHAQDQQRVTAGMERMHESCEACHAKFRTQ